MITPANAERHAAYRTAHARIVRDLDDNADAIGHREHAEDMLSMFQDMVDHPNPLTTNADRGAIVGTAHGIREHLARLDRIARALAA